MFSKLKDFCVSHTWIKNRRNYCFACDSECICLAIFTSVHSAGLCSPVCILCLVSCIHKYLFICFFFLSVSAGMILLPAPHHLQHRLPLPLLASSRLLVTPLLSLPPHPRQPWLLLPGGEGWVSPEPWWTSASGPCSLCWALRNWPQSDRPVSLERPLTKPSTSHIAMR